VVLLFFLLLAMLWFGMKLVVLLLPSASKPPPLVIHPLTVRDTRHAELLGPGVGVAQGLFAVCGFADRAGDVVLGLLATG